MDKKIIWSDTARMGFGRYSFAVGRIIIEIHLKTNAKRKYGTPKYMEHGNTA